MAAASPIGPPVTGDQFYVTHCTTADSVLNAPGYSVRATSVTSDPEALRHALQFPPYELPLEMWRTKPSPSQAPRRLARVKHPVQGIWVAHSVFREKDTMNRDRSYFTHLLHLPETVGAGPVLESWGADEWVTDYPPGATKVLPRGRLPVGSLLSPAALSAFLARTPTDPADLAVTVCPRHFRGSIEARRQLVGRFLHAVVLVAAARDDDTNPRDRLFVHAEPGLVALLTYAAIRLLPPTYTRDLTFTTFEPAHRGLRDFRLATIIGTYISGSGKGLDADLTSNRGYGLDTFYPEKSSPELRDGTGLPPGIQDLISLAAAGEWDVIAHVHRLCGVEGGPTLGRVSAVIPLARAAGQLTQGEPTAHDLIVLKADRRGLALLKREERKVWAVLGPAALTDPALRASFRDWLAEPDRLTEYRRQACEALARGDLSGWDSCWLLLRETTDPAGLKNQVERVLETLELHLPSLAREARDRLRSACAASGAWPNHHLLMPASLEELDALLAPPTPVGWQGAVCLAVLRSKEANGPVSQAQQDRQEMRDRVRRFLITASEPVLAEYARLARPHVATEPAILDELFHPPRPECVPFLSRLILAAADILEPADWFRLLDRLDVYTGEPWKSQNFLFQKDHLARLLAGFKADPVARTFWQWALDQLSPQLVQGDSWELGIYDQLVKARQALGAANIRLTAVLSEGGPAKLNAADTLLSIWHNPAAATACEPGELLLAMNRFGIEPLEGLVTIYRKHGYDRLDLNHDPAALDPFLAVFRACYPVTNPTTARTATTQWLALSRLCCPSSMRPVFQYQFVRACVPLEYQRQLVEDDRQFPFDLQAAAWIRQRLGEPVKLPEAEDPGPPATAHAAPVVSPLIVSGSTPSSVPATSSLLAQPHWSTTTIPVVVVSPPAEQPEDQVIQASPTMRRTRRGRGVPSGASRRQTSGDSGVLAWLVVLLTVVVTAAIVGLVVWKFTYQPARSDDGPDSHSAGQTTGRHGPEE